MSDFEFATATRIVFGCGAAARLGELARPFGQRALLATGSNPDRFPRVREALRAAGIATTVFSATGEPTVALAREGAEAARREGVDMVIALGGGSVIDAGKAVAGLATNEGDVLRHLEVIGEGLPLREAPLPLIAAPTTAGAGAEVTRNAVLLSPDHRVKVSLRSPRLLPAIAVVDPELCVSAPPSLTASTGMDALTQCLEPYVCSRANPISDALCRDGVARVTRGLERAFADGGDLQARSEMSVAALFGGLALANAGLGAVHGFAGPLGGMFPAPHGAVCAALLPAVIRVNARALRERAPDAPALSRYRELARIARQDEGAEVRDLVDWTTSLSRKLGIAGLSRFGVAEKDFDEIVEKSRRASSMRPNPIELTRSELREILTDSMA